MINTKLYILLSACLLFICGEAHAQTPFKRELSVGIGGGVNFSSVGFTSKVDQTMLMGLHMGGSLRWITEKNLGLIAEISFAQQGWKEDFPNDKESANPVGYEYSRTLNYIDLTFLTHIYFGSDRARFVFNLGPKIGYMLSDSEHSKNFPTNIDPTKNEGPNRTNYQHGKPIDNRFDWGLCGGPGIEIRTGVGHFLLEGRYFLALGNIYGSQKKDEFAKSNGQTISVKLSYFIPLRRK